MATSSSSLLPLFIDTDLDTHFSFTIDGHQSIAQLKGRIVSEHANCFPGFGEISVMAVKAKVGEFFYHLSDSMILNCFFQRVEGAKRFQVDIVCVSSTSKSSDQVKTNTDARMHDGQLEKLEHLNCKSSDGASNAKMKEKVQFDASLKDSRYFKPRRIKKNEVSSNENTSVDDSLQKINRTLPENPPEEILLKETVSICNNKCSNSYIHEAPVQLGTNTATKDLSDLKHKRKRKKKVSRNEELSANPLVEDSVHKVNDTRAENHSTVKEAISIRNDFGNESGIAASIKESSRPSTVQHVESSVKANVDDKHYNSNDNGSGSNRRNPEKVNSGSGTKDDSIVDLNNTITSPVEHGDSSMSKVADDASQKIQIKIDIDTHMEKILPETDEVANRNRIHGAPVQLDANTTVKDSTDPKHKRKKKKSRNKELSAKPLVEDSLHKINDTRADNQPKESIVKETIINSNDFGNESGTAASIKESSQPSTVQHVELLLQANVDDKHKGKGMVIEMSSPAKPLNNTSSNLDSGMHETNVSSADLLKCHTTTTDKMLEHEHIKENSTGNDPPTLFSNEPASQIPKDRFILGLAISLKETTSEATGKHGDEKIATLDNNIKEIAPPQKRRKKCVVRKIPRSRSGNQSMKTNEDELAPTFMQSEKNDGSGSNTHETEKAKSGCNAKDDSNVSLDDTKTLPDNIPKTLPEKRRKRLFFSSPVGENKGTPSSGLES